jgi:broad specificity phosphatase PhoE
MQIDFERFKKEGQQYVDALVGQLKAEEWENLKFAKLQNAGPEELELMKNLWSHGFTKGAEAATQLSMALHAAISQKK